MTIKAVQFGCVTDRIFFPVLKTQSLDGEGVVCVCVGCGGGAVLSWITPKFDCDCALQISLHFQCT